MRPLCGNSCATGPVSSVATPMCGEGPMLTAELLEQKFVTERSLISPEACPALVLNADYTPLSY